jgi:dCMP deaminase
MANFRREKWDRRFLELAELIATWSKDPSTKVGAVLTHDNKVIGLGYNGFPHGIKDDAMRYEDRDTKYKLVVHAEVNAILMAGEKAKGGTLYIVPSFMSPPICNECCKLAIQAGVKEIVGYLVDESTLNSRQLRWKESLLVSRIMCDEAGVRYRGIHKTDLAEEA